MAAYQCGYCTLRYPHETRFKECPACGHKTYFVPLGTPSEEWQHKAFHNYYQRREQRLVNEQTAEIRALPEIQIERQDEDQKASREGQKAS